ncbi:MAG: transglycosylase SLT domain-containing protein, partial [Candidatus Tectomicrobia bacterium]|nr:transglycosylase SLT domain-containing protein [Candidatus Tectomicrobia bacterium]
RPEAARRDLNRLLKEYPESPIVPKALFRLGAHALATKPAAGGIQILEDFLRRYPSDPLAAEALYVLGRHYWRENRPVEARKYLLPILSFHPGSARFPEAHLIIGRTYEEEGFAEKARQIYDQLLDIAAPQEVLVEALWRLGWSFYQSSQFAEAYSAWQQGASLTSGTGDGERFTYWQARTSEKMGAHGQALTLLRNLLERAPFSYYGHLARYQLEQKGETTEQHWPKPRTDPDLLPPPLDSWSQNPRVRTALAFLHLEFLSQARRELDVLSKELPEGSESRYWLGELYSRGGYFLQTFQNLSRYLQQVAVEKRKDLPLDFWKKLYPVSYRKLVMRQASSQRLPVPLLYAIIRQESAFQPKAVSRAGARGLMQLLPGTAQELLGKSRHIQPQDLFDPGTNIALGSKYLAKLIQSYSGKIPFVLASYNAGEQALKRWIPPDQTEMDTFIESIPYSETRNYVKNVVRNLLNYEHIYSSPDGRTARGGISLDKVWGE